MRDLADGLVKRGAYSYSLLLDAAEHANENHAQQQSECLDCIFQKTGLILPRRRPAQRGAGPHHRGENRMATSTSEAPCQNGNKLHLRSIFSRSFWGHHLRSLICMTVTLRTPQALADATPVRMPGFELGFEGTAEKRK
jgi:hypothetical protein